MSLTVSLSTLLLLAALLACCGVLLRWLHRLFWTQPREFEKAWRSQGVGGKAYRFPLGQLPEIQEAVSRDAIVEYAQSCAKEYGLLQTQIVGCMCQVVVYDPEVVRAVMTTRASCYHKASDSQKEIMRPLLHNGLLLSEDAYWKQQRTLLAPGFHFWYLQEMVPIIADCVRGWTDGVEAQIAAAADAAVVKEMSHELASITLDSVATAAFGAGFRSDPQRADRFIHSLKQVLEAMQERTLNLLGFIPGLKSIPFPSLRRIQNGCAEMDRIVGSIVADRKEGRSAVVAGGSHDGIKAGLASAESTRRRDLLDLLLDAQSNLAEGQTLTDQGVQEESVNFIAAGAETTSNLCVWMLHRIVSTPEVYARVKEEIDRVIPRPGGAEISYDHLKELRFLEAVAFESLRLHPPAPTIPKYAIADHVISLSNGREIHVPAGSTLLINVNVIHRLEEYWPQAEQFKPERFLAGAEMEQQDAPETADGERATQAKSAANASAAAPLTADEKAKRAAQPFAFLGFSAGPRKCIGKNLAMLEIKLIFTILFQRFDFALVPDQYIAANAITRLPKNGIQFKLTRRKDIGADSSSSPAPADASLRQRPVTVLKPLGMI